MTTGLKIKKTSPGRWRLLFWSKVQSLISILERFRRGISRLRASSADFNEARASLDLFSEDSPSAPEIYTKEALGRPSGLSPVELAEFQEKGWIGPFSLLQPRGVHFLERVNHRFRGRFTGFGNAQRPWIKSLHVYLREFHDTACHPAIVDRVASILGPDLMAWGFSVNNYFPGKIHPWHIDMEHYRRPGVSVFLGLKNITMKSTLKVINGSQRIGKTPRELGVDDDESALAASSKFESASELVSVPVREGEFFIFAGPIWHGSHNTSLRTRSAAIMQYSRTDQKMEVPLDYNSPDWCHPSPPPCVLVKGRDRWGLNWIVERP